MLSHRERLNSLKKSKLEDEVTSFYYLIKELHCLPDIVGREFEVDYDELGRIKKIRQLPMKISTMGILFEEMEKDYKRQEQESKKMKHKGRKR